jgi:hypothetical protein
MMRHRAIWRTSRAPWPWAALLVFFLASSARAADQPERTVPPAASSPAEAERSPSNALLPSLGDLAEKQAPAPRPAVCQTFRVREQDQIWLVSTRHLGCPSGGKYGPTFQLWQYVKGLWQPRTAADFYASDSPDVVTPLYVHGNQIDSALAANYGLSFYFELVGKLDADPPVRFVIWSWPSDIVKGALRDVREKAARSDSDAYYLARFLAGIKPDVRVGVLGYSYGARIVSGAMHLLAGGPLLGQSLSPSQPPHFHVALWAAAEHDHWYLPGHFHSQALAAAEAWFVTINCCDPILSRYRLLDRRDDPVAVGHSGIYGRNLLAADVNARIEEVNVSNIVGGEHNWRPYLYSRYIQDRTRDYLLWHPLHEHGFDRY